MFPFSYQSSCYQNMTRNSSSVIFRKTRYTFAMHIATQHVALNFNFEFYCLENWLTSGYIRCSNNSSYLDFSILFSNYSPKWNYKSELVFCLILSEIFKLNRYLKLGSICLEKINPDFLAFDAYSLIHLVKYFQTWWNTFADFTMHMNCLFVSNSFMNQFFALTKMFYILSF